MVDYFSSIAVYQWLTVAFSVLMLAKAVSHYRHHKMTTREIITWVAIWGSVGGLAMNPRLLDKLGTTLGVKNGVDGLLSFWLIILTYAVFRLFISNEKHKKAITDLTRTIAQDHFSSTNNHANESVQAPRDHRVFSSPHRRDGESVSRPLQKSS